MSDGKVNTQKITIWKKKIEDLEKELGETMIKRGEAAAMGDLRENAAYQMLTEKAEILSAQMADIQKMLKRLESDDKKAK